MNKLIFKLRLNKKVASDGIQVGCEFLVFLNDFEPRTFQTRNEVRDYLQAFRNTNEICKLQIYRVETYSL